MTFSNKRNRVISEPASGWTAYLSGLRDNKTVDGNTNRLLYDKNLEWDGGTPSHVEAAYVATRILRAMPPVKYQHAYVHRIKNAFLEQTRHLLSQRQLAALSASNTMAIPVSEMVNGPLPFGLDYKIVSGTPYLRIGFGIHNLKYHLGALVDFLVESSALK